MTFESECKAKTNSTHHLEAPVGDCESLDSSLKASITHEHDDMSEMTEGTQDITSLLHMRDPARGLKSVEMKDLFRFGCQHTLYAILWISPDHSTQNGTTLFRGWNIRQALMQHFAIRVGGIVLIIQLKGALNLLLLPNGLQIGKRHLKRIVTYMGMTHEFNTGRLCCFSKTDS